MQNYFSSTLVSCLNRDIGNLHSLYAIGTMTKQLPVCQLFGSIFVLQTLSIGCHKSFSQCWHTVCQISDTHILCVCVCIVCPGGAV